MNSNPHSQQKKKIKGRNTNTEEQQLKKKKIVHRESEVSLPFSPDGNVVALPTEPFFSALGERGDFISYIIYNGVRQEQSVHINTGMWGKRWVL